MNIYISQCSVCYIYITGNVLLFVWPRYMYFIPEISEPNENHGVSAIPANPANPQSEAIRFRCQKVKDVVLTEECGDFIK